MRDTTKKNKFGIKIFSSSKLEPNQQESTSKITMNKTVEAIGDLVGSKIADMITSMKSKKDTYN